jgi:cysteine desulfurase family protein (TIGR01976 family)
VGYDVSAVRRSFPALAEGAAHFDGPGGSQVAAPVAEAVAGTLRSAVANRGLVSAAEQRAERIVTEARAAVADLLGCRPAGVVFGRSMTALSFDLARTLASTWTDRDEVVVTRLDHDANVRPWVIAAGRAGATVRFADPEPETLELPASAVEAVLTDRTSWIAVTAASNAVGTVPDLPGIVAAAHAAGARVYVDAVHAAPHRALDVDALGCDALACSAYKWFGPHAAVLWGRPEVLEPMRPDKLRPSPDELPDRFELGTLPFEALAGVRAAAEFMISLDRDALRAHEDALLGQMLDGLRAIDGVTVHGAARDRAPTVMFTVDGRPSVDVARALAAEQVAAWHGNYYALELARHVGVERDGAVRAGAVAYTDEEDVRRLLDVVARL